MNHYPKVEIFGLEFANQILEHRREQRARRLMLHHNLGHNFDDIRLQQKKTQQ